MFTIDNFVKGLECCINNMNIEVENEILYLKRNYRYEALTDDDKIFAQIPISQIRELCNSFNQNISINDWQLFWEGHKFEVPIEPQYSLNVPHRYSERVMCTVDEHGYNIEISNASSQYIFACICYCGTHEVNLDIRPISHVILSNRKIETVDDLNSYLFRIMTVKISAPIECAISEFKRILQAYLFNVSYNNGIVYTIAELSDKKRPIRRRFAREGQLFPYKSYNSELVKYYYQGMSTDIPFTQYLAFYHVAEFFFQTISEQDAFQEIETFITRPSFSPYRKEDIKQFYNKIKKKMRDQREDGVWDEKTGLLLCLKNTFKTSQY